MSWFSRNKSEPVSDSTQPLPDDGLATPEDQKLYRHIHEMDRQQAYDMFQDSYQKATGQAWDQNKFEQRAQGWRFYGDENGYITVREQRSGMLKLTGMAGSPRGILKGLQDLSQETAPIWGMVSEDIAKAATRYGFKRPPGILVKALIGQIPPEVFGHAQIKNVGFGGGVTFGYDDVGDATKFFIATTAYYQAMLSDERLPRPLRAMLKKLV